MESVSAFFAKGCVHITNSKQRKHRLRPIKVCRKCRIIPWPLRVLPPLSVGKMTLRLYGAINYSQNSVRDLRCAQMERKRLFCKGMRTHHQQVNSASTALRPIKVCCKCRITPFFFGASALEQAVQGGAIDATGFR